MGEAVRLMSDIDGVHSVKTEVLLTGLYLKRTGREAGASKVRPHPMRSKTCYIRH
jgi:hypothetical protein